MSDRLYQAFVLDGRGSATTFINQAEAFDFYHQQNKRYTSGAEHSELNAEKMTSAPVIWQHLHFEDEENIDWLENNDALSPHIVEGLISPHSRPRTSFHKNGVFVSLRGMNLQPEQRVDDMVSIRMWITDDQIISTYRRKLSSTKDIIESFEIGEGPVNAVEWLDLLIERILCRMQNSIDEFDDAVTVIEDTIFDENACQPTAMQDISSIKRQIISLRRFILPELEAIGDLGDKDKLQKTNVVFSDAHLVSVNESKDLLKRHIEHIAAIHDRATVLQDESSRLSAQELNSRMFTLSIVTAIFLPISFFAGLLGVNLSGIPWADNANSFSILVVVLIVLVVFQFIYFKWKKWF